MQFSGIRGRLAGVLAALALFLMAAEAKALTITDLGPVSSSTGTIDLTGTLAAFTATDFYQFKLTGPAQLTGHFAVGTVQNSVKVQLLSFGGAGQIISGFAGRIRLFDGVHDFPFNFQVDLGAGFYGLFVSAAPLLADPTGSVMPYVGTLSFGASSVATTPIPPAILLFVTALGGLAAFRRRRRGLPAA